MQPLDGDLYDDFDYLDRFYDDLPQHSLPFSHEQQDSRELDDYLSEFAPSSPSSPQHIYPRELLTPPNRRYNEYPHIRSQMPHQEAAPSKDEHNNQRNTPTREKGMQATHSYNSKGSLRPVSKLPDMFRGIFKFTVFNAMQSECLDLILDSKADIVVSAPTGSGKTVLFELAILAAMSNSNPSKFKVVYMAPTKSLCSERSRDWTSKFEPLGLKTYELTGDTFQFGKSAWQDIKNSSIIVTTAEKWDTITRNWHEHDELLSQIQLFLVDEVHILNESRGSTLEVVISRMKTRGGNIRFLLVSATVPNIQDISSWISSNRKYFESCKVLEFGEEYRPCKLQRIVIGVPRSNKQNDFQYSTVLDNHLFPIVQQHSVMKPMLIFCPTRKSTLSSASALTKGYEEAQKKKERLPWLRPSRTGFPFNDKRLEEYASRGIGIHHAGLTMDDRRTVEDLFLNHVLPVLVATTTLSVGVNLPAHTVIIRGVKIYQNNTTSEYSDLDIVQMMGRAGRPQFDKDGVAIIICEPPLVGKYQALTQGKSILESSLHHNLSEHLNSEIALGTITSVQSAKDWLRGSFLHQRIQKNPQHYNVQQDSKNNWNDRLDDIVLRPIKQLEETNLVRRVKDGPDSNEQLISTDYGDIMCKFYVRQSTMANILQLPAKTTLREIFEVIASAEEFSTLKLRASEKIVYNELRRHNDIRFEMKRIEGTADKVLLLIQAILGNIPLNTPELRKGDSQPYFDALSVFKHAPRLAKVIVEIAITKRHGAQLLHGLEASRCLVAKAWEDRSVVLRQIEQIGEKSLKVLAEHGICSLDALRQQSPTRIEILLNRKPPFGLEVLASLAEIPQYHLDVSQLSMCSDAGKSAVSMELQVKCGTKNIDLVLKTKKRRLRYRDMSAILTITSDMDLIDFRRIPTKAFKEPKSFVINAEFTKPSQSITVLITSEAYAGSIVKYTLKPDVPPEQYPTLDTRPLSLMDLEIQGFENDPNFWNMTFDEEQETTPADVAEGSVSYKSDARKNDSTRCKHTCANRNKCLHECCKRGVNEAEMTTAQTNILQVKPTGKAQDARKATKRAHNTPSSQMEVLDRLHAQTNVESSLKLQGQRLKVDGPKIVGQKRKNRPAFDLSFTHVATIEDIVDFDVLEESYQDDLPDVEDILVKHTPRNITLPSCKVDGKAESVLLSGHSPFKRLRPNTNKKRAQNNMDLLKDSATIETQDASLFYAHSPDIQELVDKSTIKEADWSPVIVPESREAPLEDNGKEEFAELDAWLNSGYVEMD